MENFLQIQPTKLSHVLQVEGIREGWWRTFWVFTYLRCFRRLE